MEPEKENALLEITGQETEASASVSMPAFSAEQTASNGITATIRADEGAFPEGTSVSVAAVSRQVAMDAAQTVLDEEVVDAAAVDITFYDKNGRMIEPANQVSVHVTLSTHGAVEGDSYEVVHILDAETAERFCISHRSRSGKVNSLDGLKPEAIRRTIHLALRA